MIPLFKSDFSIGKSILRVDKKSFEEDHPSSIFKILKENSINNLTLVEDSMTGFLEAQKNCEDLNVKLIFGLRVTIPLKNNHHKIIIFSKNKTGCQDLCEISTYFNTKDKQFLNFNDLSKMWTKNLLLAIPFYDSFIFQNIMYFLNINLNFNFCDPVFFIENNSLPFDRLVKNKVAKFCDLNNYKSFYTKSIYYNNKEDFSDFQTYKCICSRSFSRSVSIESPNLDHCSSDQFSFESFLNNEVS